ncbi:MAG: hypothetical protein KTR33_11985, partial [Gammaproteobacteria bacterium]|nr:hypothetical protein [Gammaproteobacteria bacterium]
MRMSKAARGLLIGLATVAATASTRTNAETGSDSAQTHISITKLPSLNVSRVRNGELLFSVDRRSNQSFLQLDSGGQTMPYRLAAS